MKISKYLEYKPQIRELRTKGMSFGEIRQKIGVLIPKSTLSNWCSDIELSFHHKARLLTMSEQALHKGRLYAWESRKESRKKYIKDIKSQYSTVHRLLQVKETAFLSLVFLYWGEGAKTIRGALRIGNSDPALLRLFISLLRTCFLIDDKKLRCVVQYRADQDIDFLESYWSKELGVPRSQFTKGLMDPRTVGRPTKKVDYMGVCVLHYYSADVYNRIKVAIEILSIDK